MKGFKISKEVKEWLINSNPWTKYGTITKLLDYKVVEDELMMFKNEMINHDFVQDLIAETKTWFPKLATRHTDANMSHYKLRMLLDFGLSIDDECIQDIVTTVKSRMKDELFTIHQELPVRGDNSKYGKWNALPCDSPLITYCLLGLGDDSDEVLQSLHIIEEKWDKEGGWFCHLPFVNGQFKKTKIGCPMASLQYLELLSIKENVSDKEVLRVFESIKCHYESKKSLYYFGRGKKFWTLKYPYVWYNALYLSDVLTRFEILKKEPLVIELIDFLETSMNDDGTYTPTSMFRNYKEWDFANKKEPSPWITLKVYIVLKQFYSLVNR